MTEAQWRSVAIVLAVVLAVLVGTIVVTGLPGGSAGPTASPSIAIVSPSTGASGSPGASTQPSGGSNAPGSTAPSASASAGSSASPSASPTPVPTAGLAQVRFTDVRLDATGDPDGKARTFTFKTDGPGTVTAKLTAKSPQGTTRFCLKVGASTPLCRNWASGTLKGITSSKTQTTFTITLRGVGIATPTVDLALTFRAKSPSVTVTNARFDGTATESEGYNGLNGRARIRSGGQISVRAEWGGHPFDYTYSLVDLADPSGGGVFPGNGTGIDRTDPATPAHDYAFSLVNGETGFGRTPLTLTIAWK
jgi:hypothetical protein